MNDFYPISLNLNNKLCIVIGGGNVALRRVYNLLESGAMVKIVSPTIKPGFKNLMEIYPRLLWTKAYYTGPEDLKGASLVFAATDNPSINKKILNDANSLNIFGNIASSGQLSDFIIPSSFKQGELQVSVSTSGKVPGLSKAIKESLELTLDSDYETLINILSEVRCLAIADLNNKTENLHILSDITNNYYPILKDLSSGVDPNTIQNRLIGLLK